MPQNDTVLDAATRFLRSNPELLELARRGAAENRVSVEALLADTVRRVRRSGFEAVTGDARSRLVVLRSGDPRRDGERQTLHGSRR